MLPAVRLRSREVLLDDRPDGVSVRIFHSFCDIDGRRWCATRRVEAGDWPGSTVELDGERLDFGEDPRLFVHDGRPALVAVTHMAGYGLRNHLYEFRDGGFERSHLVLPHGLAPGKNWSPFTAPDGTIGFIHGFDPPTILREKRRERGVVVLEAHVGERIAPEQGPGDFPAFRGGTNGIAVDNTDAGGFTIGIGHTTRYRPGQLGPTTAELGFDHLRHRPFGWVLSHDATRLRLFEIEFDFPPEFDVIDPTSLIQHPDGEFELFTTEVNRHFHDPAGHRQVAAYRFTLDDAFRQAAQESLRWDHLPATRFVAHDGTTFDASIQVELRDRVGHVITGPYIFRPEGRYRATFKIGISGCRDPAGTIQVDVTSGADRVLAVRRRSGEAQLQTNCELDFVHSHPEEALEFRTAVSGFDSGRLHFTGVDLSV